MALFLMYDQTSNVKIAWQATCFVRVGLLERIIPQKFANCEGGRNFSIQALSRNVQRMSCTCTEMSNGLERYFFG